MALTSASVTRERDARPPGRLPAGSMSVRRDHLPPRMHAFAQADMRYEVSRSKPHFRNPGAEGNRLTPNRINRPSNFGQIGPPMFFALPEAPPVPPNYTFRGTGNPVIRPLLIHEPHREPIKWDFQAFGIPAYPTKALRKQICIDFICPTLWCPKANLCPRIHPKDKAYYVELLSQREFLGLFHPDHPDIVSLTRVESEDSALPTAGPGKDESNAMETHLTEAKLSDIIPPMRDAGWNSGTGEWDFALHEQAWSSGDSSVSGDITESLVMDHREPRIVDDSVASPRRSPHRGHAIAPQRESVQRSRLVEASCPGLSQTALKIHSRARQSTPELASAKVFVQPDSEVRSAVNEDVHQAQEECRNWALGKCWRGKLCRYRHADAQSTSTQVAADVKSAGRPFQRPPFSEICKHWLRGDCMKAQHCNYTHGDLRYDDSIPPRKLMRVPPPTVECDRSLVLHEHIKIKVTSGFEITEVVTGFETSWIYVGNIPKSVRQNDLDALLRKHGQLVDLRMADACPGPFVFAKARYTDAAEALKAINNLNGLVAFKSTLSAQLSISTEATTRTRLNDTSVRVSWEAPAKSAFVGFSSEGASQKALNKVRYVSLGKYMMKARVHTGLPAVGRFNLRLDGVPADIDIEELKQFIDADGVMWGPTNYTSNPKAVNGIQRMIKESGADVLDIEIMPPPFKGGMMVAWVHLATPGDARSLCEYMHARKPGFTGNTRIYARHMQSLEYSLPPDIYEVAKNDIVALAATAWRMGHFTVSTRPRACHVAVKLGAEDLKGLSMLKAELDIILSGEVVREKGKVVWDRFFGSMAGHAFISTLESKNAPLKIQVDKHRKTIRLFGVSKERLAAKIGIMEKMEVLRKQSTTTLAMDPRVTGVLVKDGLQPLTKELGDGSVQLNLWDQTLTVRGDLHAANTARDILIRLRRGVMSRPIPMFIQCPVCYDAVTAPVTLSCGHSWCRTCLTRYLTTAVDLKTFPLTCLGNDTKCQVPIPLSCAQQLLPPQDYDAIVEASFAVYVQQRPNEFSYCPTPDCQQIYRLVPRHARREISPNGDADVKNTEDPSASLSVGTILQCPSCLVRICASCQTEAHDGLVCVRPDEGDGLFDEWMKDNDVKPCPGCKMPIEKDVGCHHVTCAVCSTHLCWLCMMPFQNGAGVYGHMLAVHGSFV